MIGCGSMKRIAVLTGGMSSEREIALRSAKNVAGVLSEVYEVTIFALPSALDDFLDRRSEFDVVVPVLHGVGGEDGTIQGFLETIGMPYLFSGVQAHAIAMDKIKTKTLVSAAGVRVPDAKIVSRGTTCVFDGPAVVKPYDGGSSVATAIVRSQEELDAAIKAALELSDCVMVETYIEGQEFTVAIADLDETPTALPVIAIKPKDGFFDFASKYNAATLADEICPAPISDALAHKLQHVALQAHAALGCRQVSRSDMIVDANGEIWFLEINTIPGMTELSLLPKAIAASGRTFNHVLVSWIESVSHYV